MYNKHYYIRQRLAIQQLKLEKLLLRKCYEQRQQKDTNYEKISKQYKTKVQTKTHNIYNSRQLIHSKTATRIYVINDKPKAIATEYCKLINDKYSSRTYITQLSKIN